MCGAASESVLLAVPIAKVGDEKSVLKDYNKPKGRSAVVELVFGKNPKGIEQRFGESAMNLLT